MTNIQLYYELNSLPANLKKEVEDFIYSLKTKSTPGYTIKKREFGSAKGFFKIKPDFDEPLEDFKDYC